jgi:hypothetical protein
MGEGFESGSAGVPKIRRANYGAIVVYSADVNHWIRRVRAEVEEVKGA